MSTMSKKELFFWIAMLLIIALLVTIPLPLFPMDTITYGADALFHLGRIEGIKEGLLAGQIPVRVNPVQLGGYGMPTGIFYPDFFLYLPAFLRLTGVSLLTSWKIFLALVNIVTVFVGWWAFSLYIGSKRMGAIAAMFYTIFFFRLGLMYILTAVAEILAMAFLPAALIAIWVTVRKDTSYWPAATFFSVCVLLSHILTSIFLVIATVLFIVVSIRRFRQREVCWAVAKAVGFIVLLTIWFYAPFLYFYTHMDFMIKSVMHQEIWYHAIFPLKNIDFYIGSSLLLLIVGLSIYILFHRKYKRSKEFFKLLLGSSFFLYLISHPAPWHIMGSMVGFIQTPFRLIEFPAIFLSLAVAIGIGAIGLEKWRSRCLVIVCAVVSLGANFLWMYGYTYAVPPQPRQRCAELHITQSSASEYFSKTDPEYVTTVDYMDKGAYASIVDDPSKADDRFREKSKDHAIHPEERIQEVVRTGNAFEIRYQAGEAQWIHLPLFWYMGYAAQDIITGKTVPVQKDEQGQVSIFLQPSAGSVRVWYEGLPWFHVTDLLSWFSWFGFFYIAYRSAKERKRI